MTRPGGRVTTWDSVVVGAGPAGLSAAVYLGRFRRRTLVLDCGDGRWSYGQTNDNYLGFPGGVPARRLHALGRAQAERFGVRFRAGEVTAIARKGGAFVLTAGAKLAARTVVWAAGVHDIWPEFPGARALVGKVLFWCIVCDGWRALGRPIVLLGDDRKAARTALQFLTYTPDITFVTRTRRGISRAEEARLAAAGIRVVRGEVARALEAGHGLRGVQLAGRARVRAELIFSLYGSEPRTALLRALPVALARNGHVRVDAHGRTNLARFFAAGDVTNRHAHQVSSAVHEGAEAAMAANHVLYPERQRL
jgi:thioredoxin reductase (NADPH)